MKGLRNAFIIGLIALGVGLTTSALTALFVLSHLDRFRPTTAPLAQPKVKRTTTNVLIVVTPPKIVNGRRVAGRPTVRTFTVTNGKWHELIKTHHGIRAVALKAPPPEVAVAARALASRVAATRTASIATPRGGSITSEQVASGPAVAGSLSSGAQTSGTQTAGLLTGVSGDKRVFLDLHVNTLDEGETLAVLRSNDILIPTATLEQAGVRNFAGARATIRNEQYVSLASLAPSFGYVFNEDQLSLNVTVKPSYLGSTTVDLTNVRPEGLEYVSSRSGYINYSLNRASEGTNAFVEAGAFSGKRFGYSSFNASGHKVQRGLSYIEVNDRFHAIRRTYGDLVTSSGDLGGSAFVGGVGSSRAFDLDPYAVHFPTPTLSGAVTTPSVAEVYVNGVLIRRIDLAPGNFNLNEIPVAGGSVTTKVVLTDAFGHTQTFSQGYYASADLLNKGTTDFQYAAGLKRENAFGSGDRYSAPVISGRYRVGVTSNLTAGGRLEATSGLLSFGPAADVRLRKGLFHIATAVSRDLGYLGGAISMAFASSSPRFGVNASLSAQSSHYANLSQRAIDDRALLAISSGATLQLGRNRSINAQFARRVNRDNGSSTQAALGASMPIGHNYNLTLTAEHDKFSFTGVQNSITAGLTFSFGRTSGSLTSRAASQGTDTTLQLQESPHGAQGIGYTANYDIGQNHAINGGFQYRGRYGDADLSYSLQPHRPFTNSIRYSGAVAFIGHGFYFTRPISGSYALVDVPNTPNIHVFLDNQDVGKTDRHGHLLVPQLIPNYGNGLRIQDLDAPLNTSIQTVQKYVAPPPKAGAVVTFPSERLQALVGSLIVDRAGGPVVPSYGELTLEKGTFKARSDIGKDGEFYLENVPSGTYQAHVIFGGGDCAFTLNAPATDKMEARLGTLHCVMGAARTSQHPARTRVISGSAPGWAGSLWNRSLLAVILVFL